MKKFISCLSVVMIISLQLQATDVQSNNELFNNDSYACQPCEEVTDWEEALD
ncbi:MAG: hypothetical protein IJY10_09750 [Lachnospiraceae bacterium]|nr:hypothetical protein [Lachnospiraceae bacterium]